MTWTPGDQFLAMMAQTGPGPGATMVDDGVSGEDAPRNKSIRNLSTPRLYRHLAALHARFHTVEGLREYSDTKRGLADNGVKARMIAHELRLRGEDSGDCRLCW